jgi:hypothetical protein
LLAFLVAQYESPFVSTINTLLTSLSNFAPASTKSNWVCFDNCQSLLTNGDILNCTQSVSVCRRFSKQAQVVAYNNNLFDKISSLKRPHELAAGRLHHWSLKRLHGLCISTGSLLICSSCSRFSSITSVLTMCRIVPQGHKEITILFCWFSTHPTCG